MAKFVVTVPKYAVLLMLVALVVGSLIVANLLTSRDQANAKRLYGCDRNSTMYYVVVDWRSGEVQKNITLEEIVSEGKVRYWIPNPDGKEYYEGAIIAEKSKTCVAIKEGKSAPNDYIYELRNQNVNGKEYKTVFWEEFDSFIRQANSSCGGCVLTCVWGAGECPGPTLHATTKIGTSWK